MAWLFAFLSALLLALELPLTAAVPARGNRELKDPITPKVMIISMV